ncbi:MAG: hypothetical protein PF638_04000 [Candidatus Delongbacteria bacterium]|jgi:hypothetical protein|nr:hypothetical protein [Candidatus Delongbacteria bacterium]
MKNENMICNYCGSHNFDESYNTFYEVEPYGEKVEVKEKILKCKECGEEINYTYNYTDEYEKALRKSEESSVVNIIEHFTEQKIKLKDVEDSLSLPVRTLSRWKHKLNYSKIGLTLLRIARSYPWIIYVAARRFDKKVVNEAFKQAAIKKFNLVENNKSQTLVVITSREDCCYEDIYINEPNTVYNAKQTNLIYSVRNNKNTTSFKQGVR